MPQGLKRVSPRWAFLVLALLVNAVASGMAHAVSRPAVQIAAAFDLTITVTGVYYWLIVRPGYRPGISLIGVAVFGLLRAAFAFPHVVPGGEWLAGAAECGLTAALIFGFRRQSSGDPVERLRGALAGILPFETAERALAGEFSVLYYAFGWTAKPHVPEGAEPFTVHRRSGFGDMVLCLGFAALMEILPMHLLLRRWSAVAAWTLTGLSLYGAVWLAGLYRSLDRRPGFAQPNAVVIRLGLFLTLRIPAGSVTSVSSIGEARPGDLLIPRGAAPNLRVEFAEPLEAERLFGMRKPVASVALAADDPEGVTAALRRMAY
jgi:hypothetical protein